jgi:hypothetical protein
VSVLSAKPFPSRVTGCTPTVRSRSQSQVADCEGLRMQGRLRELRWTRDVQWEPARRSSSACWAKHFPSLHEINCTYRRSVASRFLAAGLLPLLQLRCSTCQGSRNLAQVRKVGCNSVQLGHPAGSKAKEVTLRPSARISQRATKKDSRRASEPQTDRSITL